MYAGEKKGMLHKNLGELFLACTDNIDLDPKTSLYWLEHFFTHANFLYSQLNILMWFLPYLGELRINNKFSKPCYCVSRKEMDSSIHLKNC